jgi:hypothetical protein
VFLGSTLRDDVRSKEILLKNWRLCQRSFLRISLYILRHSWSGNGFPFISLSLHFRSSLSLGSFCFLSSFQRIVFVWEWKQMVTQVMQCNSSGVSLTTNLIQEEVEDKEGGWKHRHHPFSSRKKWRHAMETKKEKVLCVVSHVTWFSRVRRDITSFSRISLSVKDVSQTRRLMGLHFLRSK